MGGRGRGPPHEQRRRHVRPSSRAAQGQSVAASGARGAAGGSGHAPPAGAAQVRSLPSAGASPEQANGYWKGEYSRMAWFSSTIFFPLFQDVASSVEIEEIQQNLS